MSKENVSINTMPVPLARIYIKANNLLSNKHVSVSKIEEHSGVNHSTISRLRRHAYRRDKNNKNTTPWELSRLTLKTTLLLANYSPNSNLVNPVNQSIDKFKYTYFLRVAQLRYNIDFNDLRDKVIAVTNNINNLADLGRHLGVSRTRLSRIKNGSFNIANMHLGLLSQLLNIYSQLQKSQENAKQ